jgi:2-polyprenyl-6-methoxyphenol hydroxylase-like FAD-dependent oxidoreductase
MKVLISGAGPAGLTVAYWLKHYGFTPTIVERAPHLLVGGYKIDVRGAALQVIKQMGIHDAVVAARTDMQGAQLVDKQGKVIERMSGDEFGHRVTGDLEIVRGTLCEILRGHLGEVELLFGDTIQGINQSSNNAQVQFTKNGVREFDCVIGADGLHSNVRRIAFGEESRFLRDLGLYLCVYSVPNYLKLDRMEMQYSELGRIAAIWSSRGDANAKACFGFAAPTLQIGLHDRSEQQQALKTVYEGIGWEVPRLMELMPTASDWYFDKAAQINMPRWSQGRVVLVGDAAYCASPMSGQGTSLALIGAYVLAGELAATSGDCLRAFAEYENAMRPFVEANQALGLRSSKIMLSGKNKSVSGWLLKQFMRIMPGPVLEWIINRSTERIREAANAISLKDYSSFFRSKEASA